MISLTHSDGRPRLSFWGERVDGFLTMDSPLHWWIRTVDQDYLSRMDGSGRRKLVLKSLAFPRAEKYMYSEYPEFHHIYRFCRYSRTWYTSKMFAKEFRQRERLYFLGQGERSTWTGWRIFRIQSRQKIKLEYEYWTGHTGLRTNTDDFTRPDNEERFI